MLDDDEKTRINHRMRRIIGQAEAVSRMIQEDAPCVEILMQISAANGAFSKVAQLLLADHLKYSLIDAAEAKDEEEREQILKELLTLFEKYSSAN